MLDHCFKNTSNIHPNFHFPSIPSGTGITNEMKRNDSRQCFGQTICEMQDEQSIKKSLTRGFALHIVGFIKTAGACM